MGRHLGGARGAGAPRAAHPEGPGTEPRNRRWRGRAGMDKLKKVLSGQDTEDRGGLAEVSAPPAAAGLRGAWGARWLAGGSRAGLQGFLESSSPCTRSPAAIIQ